MGTNHHDFKWIQTRLTLARWYLNAAESAAAEAARHHFHQAQNMYDLTIRALSQLDLERQRREAIERELAALGDRLESVGENM